MIVTVSLELLVHYKAVEDFEEFIISVFDIGFSSCDEFVLA